MKLSLSFVITLLSLSAIAQVQPSEITEIYTDVPAVNPTGQNGAPSDAIVLFDGRDLDKWQKQTMPNPSNMMELEPLILNLGNEVVVQPAGWDLEDGEMVVHPEADGVESKQKFGSMQLHIEWLTPVDEGKEGQGYSNSGVFFMGMYEVQILNSYDNDTYSNGQAGAIYKQRAPLVNPTNPPGQWQTYDIVFTAPVFNDNGQLSSPAKLTVLLNGVLIQNNVSLSGPTCYLGNTYYIAHPSKLPLVLQDHGDKVRFRNIWVREL